MRLLYRRYAIPICVFLYFPTLVSGESIARGSPLREIGQKPEPTYIFFTKRARSRDLAPKQRQYDKSIVKNKSEPISIYEIVRICYVNAFRQLSAKRETDNHPLCGWATKVIPKNLLSCCIRLEHLIVPH